MLLACNLPLCRSVLVFNESAKRKSESLWRRADFALVKTNSQIDVLQEEPVFQRQDLLSHVQHPLNCEFCESGRSPIAEWLKIRCFVLVVHLDSGLR